MYVSSIRPVKRLLIRGNHNLRCITRCMILYNACLALEIGILLSIRYQPTQRLTPTHPTILQHPQRSLEYGLELKGGNVSYSLG